MREFESNIPDLATPLNSQGGYGNAYGKFDLDRNLNRKVKSRKDLSQPSEEKEEPPMADDPDNATDRYLGSFSIESKRHVWDLLSKHPEFQNEGAVRKNRIHNNTAEVLRNDPIKLINNGGHVVFKPATSHDTEHLSRP